MPTKLFAALLTVALSVGIVPSQMTPVEPVSSEPPQTVVQAQPPATETTVETPAKAEQLTAQEAEDLALQKAELTREQVKISRTELDLERGVPHWEVEFRYEDWEYDYTVHAETGAILEWDKEYEPQKTVPTQPPATEPPAVETPVTPAPVTPPATEQKPAALTAEEAKAIALAHAGLTSQQVGRVKAEKDRENGVWVYEVEFQNGRWEYDYEIHAETGKILEWDKEYDD